MARLAAGEDWTNPTPEQIAACAAYDPDPEQYGTAGDDVTDNDEPCMCGTPFTCMADDHDRAVAGPVTDWNCICGSGDDGEWHSLMCVASNTPDEEWKA